MGNFETNHVYTYPKQPLVWYRFKDDIFMVWIHGHQELLKFLEHLKMVHTTLKFTYESSPTHVNVLDTYIKVEDNFLHTDLYVKPKDTHMCL